MSKTSVNFKKNRLNLSYEVFPPKKDDEFENVYTLVSELSRMNPHFISVTNGAGGSKQRKTLDIVDYIQNRLQVTALSHMTCVGFTRKDLDAYTSALMDCNVRNVLALRGDRPQSMSDEQFDAREFFYAVEMIRYLKEHTDLNICGACYPEKHFEAPSLEEDLKHMKEKQDAGAQFFISQLFFDNACFYRFMEKAGSAGIVNPVCAGIMPVTSAKQLGTTVNLSGSSVPKALSDIIARYGDNPEEMKKAGMDYAIRQILDLRKNGCDNIHIYTMNKASVAQYITSNIL